MAEIRQQCHLHMEGIGHLQRRIAKFADYWHARQIIEGACNEISHLI
jgi:hypothetical protein